MNQRTRQFIGGLGTAAVTLSTCAAVGTLSAAPAQASTVVTPYVFAGNAYGTTVSGGSLPVSSSRTAYVVSGCDNRTGRSYGNHVLATDLGAVTTGEITSSLSIYHRSSPSTDNIRAVNTIATVSAGTGAQQLRITALRSVARSWHSSTGYHSTLTRSGTITIGGTPVAFPTPTRPVSVPGIGTLAVGTTTKVSQTRHTGIYGSGLVLNLTATGSRVTLNYVHSDLRKALPAGLLGGRSFGSRMNAADGTVTSGPTALQPLKCTGTDGKVERASTLTSALPGAITVGATVDTARGAGYADRSAVSTTRSTVASADIGSTSVVLKAIAATAYVRRTSTGTLQRSTGGTTPGTITVNGTTRTLPTHGTYNVAGIATITTGLVTKSFNGVSVTAVRVKLLSGTAAGSTVELGNASAYIRH